MEQQLPPHAAMIQLATAYWVSMAIHTAAKWRVADFLADGPRTAAQLAQATQTHEDSLRRLLRSLSSVGVFAEVDGGRYALTPLSQTLRSDVPGSLREFVMMEGAEWYWRGWGQLPQAVKTGEAGFPHVHGQPVFEYLAEHPEDAGNFNRAMTAFSSMSGTEAVPERYDFSQAKTIIDIAGGHGAFLAHILKQYPHLRGVLFDQPSVIAGAPEVLAGSGVEARCTLEGGDFFESVPAGYDVYLMKQIIHDWADEPALRILRNCREAMRNDSRLLLIEQLLPEQTVPGLHHFIDLTMLVLLGSKERTAKEFQALFQQSGFELSRTLDLVNGFAIIEAKPVAR